MSDPATIGSRGRKVDDIVKDIENGPKPKAKPPYVKPATPERNATYEDMASRIYGKDAKK